VRPPPPGGGPGGVWIKVDAVTVVDGYLGHGIVGVVWCGVVSRLITVVFILFYFCIGLDELPWLWFIQFSP